MEGLGCNWKESLTSREEILVLMNPMHPDSPQPLWSTSSNCSRTGGKSFFPCKTMGGDGSLQRRCAPTGMFWTLSFGTAFTTSSQLLHKVITATSYKWDFTRNPIRSAKTGWSGDKLNLLLWTRIKGPENLHVKQGWAVKYKYLHDKGGLF